MMRERREKKKKSTPKHSEWLKVRGNELKTWIVIIIKINENLLTKN